MILHGDYISMWSPCDSSISIKYFDEDETSTYWTINNVGYPSAVSDIRVKENLVERTCDPMDLLDLQLYSFDFITYGKVIDETQQRLDLLNAADTDVATAFSEAFAEYKKKDGNADKTLDDFVAHHREALEKRIARCTIKKKGISFIAQDVQQFAPDAVKARDDADGTLEVCWNVFQHYVNQSLIDTVHTLNKRLNLFSWRRISSKTAPDQYGEAITDIFTNVFKRECKHLTVTKSDATAFSVTNNSHMRTILQDQIRLRELDASVGSFRYFDNSNANAVILLTKDEMSSLLVQLIRKNTELYEWVMAARDAIDATQTRDSINEQIATSVDAMLPEIATRTSITI